MDVKKGIKFSSSLVQIVVKGSYPSVVAVAKARKI